MFDLTDVPPEDFWERVEKEGECWVWTGGRTTAGYGNLRVCGRRPLLYAHRVAFEIQHRPLLRGEMVMHHCDNPPCVRGAHLFAGSNSDNMLDASAKGRHFWVMKTHCPHGHAYEGHNVIVRGGSRFCRECHRQRSLAHYYRTREREHAGV